MIPIIFLCNQQKIYMKRHYEKKSNMRLKTDFKTASFVYGMISNRKLATKSTYKLKNLRNSLLIRDQNDLSLP